MLQFLSRKLICRPSLPTMTLCVDLSWGQQAEAHNRAQMGYWQSRDWIGGWTLLCGDVLYWGRGGGAKRSDRGHLILPAEASGRGQVQKRSSIGGPGIKFRQFSTIFKLFYRILGLILYDHWLINKKAKNNKK